MAFVRVGHFKVVAGQSAEVAKLYEAQAIPAIRAAPGNVSAVLLQQHDAPEAFMAVTIWKTRDDAEAYDRGGQAQAMVNTIRHAFAGPPSLVTYDSYGI